MTKGQTMSTLTLTEQKVVVREAIAKYVEFMNEATKAEFAVRFTSLEADTYWVEGGRKYVKIAQGRAGGGASVHCFVDAATGDVYKAASWKAPSLNGARYNLLDEASFELLKSRFTFSGSYLYKNW